MSDSQKKQIGQWLKKLEQESWQLELLVSAFTIFLLIQAVNAFSGFYEDIPYEYDLNVNILSIIYLFIGLIGMSIKALSFCLIIHLMLRGFWIGTIGLRSVQSKIDFSKLRYSQLFNEKLKKRIVSLDEMVTVLDEICSVIFSFSFLVISVLLSFGLYLLFLGAVAILLRYAIYLTDGWLQESLKVSSSLVFLSILFTGIIYMVDYFSLGFFKKYKWLSKVYYPIYKFYGFITVSIISRSIYYYLISKFSKKRIRLLYLFFGALVFFSTTTEYDQHQYFSDVNDELTLSNHYYDNLRDPMKNIEKVSIKSNVIDGTFLQLFLRYNPADNDIIKSKCPDFEPMKDEGLNLIFKFEFSARGLRIDNQNYEEEDFVKLLSCQSSIYKVFVNDSLYAENKYYFFTHPTNQQRGLMTMLSTSGFKKGENTLLIKKSIFDDDENETLENYAYVPFWFE